AAIRPDDAALAEIAEAVLTAAVVGVGQKHSVLESASRNELPGHEAPLRFQGRRRRDDVGPSQRTGPYCFWKFDVIADQDRDAETGDIEHRVAVAWREPLGFKSVGNAQLAMVRLSPAVLAYHHGRVEAALAGLLRIPVDQGRLMFTSDLAGSLSDRTIL